MPRYTLSRFPFSRSARRSAELRSSTSFSVWYVRLHVTTDCVDRTWLPRCAYTLFFFFQMLLVLSSFLFFTEVWRWNCWRTIGHQRFFEITSKIFQRQLRSNFNDSMHVRMVNAFRNLLADERRRILFPSMNYYFYYVERNFSKLLSRDPSKVKIFDRSQYF